MIITPIAFVLSLIKKRSSPGVCYKEAPTPFFQIEAKPVSEGDEVMFAYEANNKYTASVKNKNKGKSDILIAQSKEELGRMVEETFKAWAKEENRQSNL